MAVAFNNVLDNFFIGVVQSARADVLLVSFMTEVSKNIYCWPEVPVVEGVAKEQIFCEALTPEKKGKYFTFPNIKTIGKLFGPCRDNLLATKKKLTVCNQRPEILQLNVEDWKNRRFSLKKELCSNCLE